MACISFDAFSWNMINSTNTLSSVVLFSLIQGTILISSDVHLFIDLISLLQGVYPLELDRWILILLPGWLSLSSSLSSTSDTHFHLLGHVLTRRKGDEPFIFATQRPRLKLDLLLINLRVSLPFRLDSFRQKSDNNYSLTGKFLIHLSSLSSVRNDGSSSLG